MAEWQAAGASATFVYDAAGNILAKAQDGSQPMTMTHDAGDRPRTVLRGASVAVVAYDASGNVNTENLNGAAKTCQYDAANRLTAIGDPAARRSTFSYSGRGLGRRACVPAPVPRRPQPGTFRWARLARSVAGTCPFRPPSEFGLAASWSIPAGCDR